MKSLVFSFAYLLLSNTTGAQTAQMVRDAQNMQSVLTEMAKAFNNHDAGEFSVLFSEDADFTDANGITSHGIKEIRQYYEKHVASRYLDRSIIIAEPKIRFITVDIASVDASWEIMGAKSSDRKNIPPRKGLTHLIMTRGDDKWYITVMHDMIFQ